MSKIARRMPSGSKRTKLFKRFGDRCVYCSGQATVLDHFVPYVVQGNRRLATNLLPACGLCNSIAHEHRFETFDEKRAFILDRLAQRNRLVEVYCPKGCGVTYARKGEMDRCPDCGELL